MSSATLKMPSLCFQPSYYNQAPQAANDNSFTAYASLPDVSASSLPETRRQRMRAFTAYGISLICAICLCCTVFLVSISQPLYVNVRGEDLLGLKKCPACYGVDKCPAMLSGKVQLNGWSQLTAYQMVNTKNVYFGRYMNEDVVLKKLGKNEDLTLLDETILALANATSEDGMCLRHAIRAITKAYMRSEFHADRIANAQSGSVREYLKILPLAEDLAKLPVSNEKGSDLLTCLSSGAMDFIVDRAYEFHFGQNRFTVLNNVLTMLLINPEPLILLAFPASQGWPFPKYHGACGRVIIEERVQTPFVDFAGASFARRANLARQLLEMARSLTHKNQDFSLYWSDVTEYNLAVDGAGKVKIVDAGNMILVDKNLIKKNGIGDWDLPWLEEHWNDSQGFGYIEKELCNHVTSDHNIHALCHALLAPDAYSYNFPHGLLYDAPEAFVYGNPDFLKMLEICKDPAKYNFEVSRFEAAKRLEDMLEPFKDL